MRQNPDAWRARMALAARGSGTVHYAANDAAEPASSEPTPEEAAIISEHYRKCFSRLEALIADPAGVEKAAAAAAASTDKVAETEVRILAPLTSPEKILCVGLNYRDHAIESNMAIPTVPTIFSKFNSCIIGPGDEIEIVLDPLGDLEQDVGALRHARLAPFIASLVGRVERELDVGCIRTRHFADLVAGHRREIVHVAAGFRLHPFAADVIAVFQLEGRFARFLLNLNVHDFILPDENDPQRTAWEEGGPRWHGSVEGRRGSAAHIVSHLRQSRVDPARSAGSQPQGRQ